MSILTVEKTINQAEQQYGARYTIDRTTILLYMNIIQQQAFNEDLEAFLIWNNYLTITRSFVFTSAGYVSATTAGDVVTGGTSGATGILVSYVNATRTWTISTISGTFVAGETVTAATAGSGVLSTFAIDRTYSSPSDCRMIGGITSLTDQQLLYPREGYPGIISSLPGQGLDDYGYYGRYTSSSDNSRYQWINGRTNNFNNTFTFLADPDEGANVYRLVYYRNAPEIADESDDVNYLIPDINRQSLVLNGIGVLAQNAMYGIDSAQALAPLLRLFWTSVRGNNFPNPGSNMRSEGFGS